MIYIVGLILLVGAVIFYRSKNRNVNPNDASWLVEAHNNKEKKQKEHSWIGATIEELLQEEASWEKIFQSLNKANNSLISSQLSEFRLPYMFAPNVALNILEKCHKSNPSLNLQELLVEAIHEGSKVNKFSSSEKA